jgi:hypothetical protein
MSDEKVKELLRAADPARGQVEVGLDAQAYDDLRRIVGTTRRRGKRATYGRLAMTGLAGVLAIVVLVAQPWAGSSDEGGPGTAQAGTPPMLKYTQQDKRPAKAQLLDFAARVRALPAEVPSGPVLRVTSKGWYLVSGDMAESYIEPQATTAYTVGGQIRGLEDGHVGDPVETYWPNGLSADPAELKGQLAHAHPGNSPDSFLAALGDLQAEANPGPKVRAALMTLLADQPGITAEGTVVDRAARPGVAFSLVSDGGGLPSKKTVIFDARTGVVLGTEEMLTEDAGKLNVPIPSVISYTLYLSRDYLPALPK